MDKNTDDYHQQNLDETIRQLRSDRQYGLSSDEAKRRLDTYGLNEIKTQEESVWHRLLISRYGRGRCHILLWVIFYSGGNAVFPSYDSNHDFS